MNTTHRRTYGATAPAPDPNVVALADAAKRATTRARDAERKLAERVVDQAIREDRISETDRDAWLRRFERDPDATTKVLEDLNPATPRMYFDATSFTDDENRAYDREFERMFGEKPLFWGGR